MIHYISPYDAHPEVNIGGAINRAIEQLSPHDDDWIIHVDQDVMWLLPDSKRQLENILENTVFDVLGPRTNRLAMPDQVVEPMFHVSDVIPHIEMAKSQKAVHANDILQTRENLAAFVLCFRYSVWKRVGGFVENDLRFDTQFCINAKSAGFKLGIMLGIYVFHLYRMGMPGEARKNYEHLKPRI